VQGTLTHRVTQAVDVAGLKKLQLQVRSPPVWMRSLIKSSQTIINLCIALGFLAHGYATGEFEVTQERLGCYLPVRIHHTPQTFNRSVLLQTEHVDNPKGYGDGEDPRKYDKRLRGVSNAKILRLYPH